MTLLVDIILIIALFSAIASSYHAGLIKTLGGLIGFIVGIVVAGQYFERLAHLVMQAFGQYDNLAKVISFFVIFAAVNGAIALLVYLLDSIFNFMGSDLFLLLQISMKMDKMVFFCFFFLCGITSV